MYLAGHLLSCCWLPGLLQFLLFFSVVKNALAARHWCSGSKAGSIEAHVCREQLGPAVDLIFLPSLLSSSHCRYGVPLGETCKVKYIIPPSFEDKLARLWIGCYKNGEGQSSESLFRFPCFNLREKGMSSSCFRVPKLKGHAPMPTDALEVGSSYVFSLKEGEVWPMIMTHCTTSAISITTPLLSEPRREEIDEEPKTPVLRPVGHARSRSQPAPVLQPPASRPAPPTVAPKKAAAVVPVVVPAPRKSAPLAPAPSPPRSRSNSGTSPKAASLSPLPRPPARAAPVPATRLLVASLGSSDTAVPAATRTRGNSAPIRPLPRPVSQMATKVCLGQRKKKSSF